MMDNLILVREWDAETFHRRVLALESQGFVTQLETYSITPEMNPETGEIIHLYSIDMRQGEPAANPTRAEASP